MPSLSILQTIEALPLLDSSVIQISKIASDPDACNADLSKIISKDPMLVANILHHANSPAYGFSRRITSIDQAIGLFGMHAVRGFVMAQAVKNSFDFNLSPYGLNEASFELITQIQSSLIFNWFSRIDFSVLELLSPASFLMEVGKLIIAKELIASNLANEFKERLSQITTPYELKELEIQMVGISSEVAAAEVFKRWQLEDDLAESVRFSKDPSQAPTLLKKHSAALLATKCACGVMGILGDDNVVLAMEVCDRYGLMRDSFLKAVIRQKSLKEQQC